MIICTKCSHQNADGDEFCGGCGEFLEWTGQKVESALAPEAEVEPEPQAEVEPEPQAEVEPEPQAEVEPEPQAEVEPEPVPSERVQPQPVQPEPVRAEPVQPQPVQPAAVLPTKPAPKRPDPAPATQAEPALRPGETACPSCAAGNESGRSFCRRCGASLAPPPEEAKKPSWWRKLVTKDPKVHAAGDRPMRDKKGKFKP